MAIPAHLTQITVTGQYPAIDGKPASGTVEFRLSAPAAVPIDKAIVPLLPAEARLDLTGAFTIALPASDAPAWGVGGLLYRVTERIVGASQRDPYYVNIPATAAGGTVDLSALAPAVAGPALVIYETPAGAQAKADAAAAKSLPLAGGTLTGPLRFGDGIVADVIVYRSSPGTVRTDGALSVAGGVGFNGANPVARPIVSGSRGGNAALASLLTALALQGLIVDSTTA